jgi:regulator of protease activity HflC (stomatin/prohibitin superfamily)
MKKLIIILAALAISACTFGKIDPGHVGVVVPLSGNDKGTLETASNGWYIYSFNTQVYEFPTYNQNHNWTNVEGEGNKSVDERLYFMDKNGLRIGADVGIQFHVPSESVTVLFKTYRQDLDHVRDTVLKMEVRNALNLAAQDYSAEDMFGDKRSAFFVKALALVRENVGKNGIQVDNLYLNGELKLPDQIVATIQAKQQATLFAQQKVNEKLAVEAEAAKIVAKADGDARAAVAEAKGAADSQILRATAEARSNELIGRSLQTSGILELRKLEIQADVQKAYAERWQGAVPQTILPGQAGGFMMDMRGFGGK